eukprot:jgi/Bigna1/129408/aug1.9_g4116
MEEGKDDISLMRGERTQGLALDFKDAHIPKAVPPGLKSKLESLYRDGYVVLNDVLNTDTLTEVRLALAPYIRNGKCAKKGRNNFEGHKTNRVYGLLAKSRVFDQIAANKKVLDIVDCILIKNYLLSALLAIDIHSGETPQPLHCDGQYVVRNRPSPPMGVSTIWALGEDGFTPKNGGTIILKGSHLWGNQMPKEDDVAKHGVPLEMPPGSVVIFFDTLWHCGGANVTDKPRLAITAQYCQPYVRQQENMVLSVPPNVVQNLMKNNKDEKCQRLVRMIGYSIHPPFIGHVDGQHPLKTTVVTTAKRCSKL